MMDHPTKRQRKRDSARDRVRSSGGGRTGWIYPGVSSLRSGLSIVVLDTLRRRRSPGCVLTPPRAAASSAWSGSPPADPALYLLKVRRRGLQRTGPWHHEPWHGQNWSVLPDPQLLVAGPPRLAVAFCLTRLRAAERVSIDGGRFVQHASTHAAEPPKWRAGASARDTSAILPDDPWAH